MSAATITSKGPITISAAVRRRLGVEAGDRVEFVKRILSIRQLAMQDAKVVWQALRQFESGRVDFADCLIQRIAEAAGCVKTVTFDKRAGMTLLR